MPVEARLGAGVALLDLLEFSCQRAAQAGDVIVMLPGTTIVAARAVRAAGDVTEVLAVTGRGLVGVEFTIIG